MIVQPKPNNDEGRDATAISASPDAATRSSGERISIVPALLTCSPIAASRARPDIIPVAEVHAISRNRTSPRQKR